MKHLAKSRRSRTAAPSRNTGNELDSKRSGAFWLGLVFLLFMTACSAVEYRRIGNGQTQELSCESIALSSSKNSICGPQAVAQVCKFWGLDVNEQELLNQTSNAGSDGSRLGKLKEWAQQHGLNARLYHGSPQDLGEKIAAGMPVIAVLDVNRYPGIPHPLLQKKFWGHAIAVTGFDEESSEVIVCDGGEASRIPYKSFFRDWQAADWVTLLLWPEDKTSSAEKRLGSDGGGNISKP